MNRKLIEPLALLMCAAVLLTVVVVWIKTGWPLFTALGVVLIGWWSVITRIGPQVEWNIAGIATAVLCIVATVFLLHHFARWLYGAIRFKKLDADWPAAWRWKWTCCVLASVMMMFIAGLVGVGLFKTTSWFVETPQVIVQRTRIL